MTNNEKAILNKMRLPKGISAFKFQLPHFLLFQTKTIVSNTRMMKIFCRTKLSRAKEVE